MNEVKEIAHKINSDTCKAEKNLLNYQERRDCTDKIMIK